MLTTHTKPKMREKGNGEGLGSEEFDASMILASSISEMEKLPPSPRTSKLFCIIFNIFGSVVLFYRLVGRFKCLKIHDINGGDGKWFKI